MTPVPLILIVVSLPLAFGLVPRNRLYGFRLPSTMTSDAVWYRANRIFAIAMIAAGLLWLLLQWALSIAFPPPGGPLWADRIGWAVFGISTLCALWALRRPA